MKMKNILNIALVSAIGLGFASCTKVIDVNLDNVAPVMVVEANITDTAGPYQVRLNKTIDIDKDNNFPAVQNATVTMSDDAGNTETLQETAAGVYTGTAIQGVSGRTYTLTIATNDGETYTAVSTMPQKVTYDSLGMKAVTGFDGEVLYPTVYFTDPAGVENYYRAVRYVNGIPDGDLYIRSDQFSDGNSRELILFAQGPPEERNLMPGDVVTVELRCINEQMYDYLTERSEADGNSQAATPANPEGNISNDALGYFSAHTSDTKKLNLP